MRGTGDLHSVPVKVDAVLLIPLAGERPHPRDASALVGQYRFQITSGEVEENPAFSRAAAIVECLLNRNFDVAGDVARTERKVPLFWPDDISLSEPRRQIVRDERPAIAVGEIGLRVPEV